MWHLLFVFMVLGLMFWLYQTRSKSVSLSRELMKRGSMESLLSGMNQPAWYTDEEEKYASYGSMEYDII